MKKTIKILAEKIDKLQEKHNGTLHGGFASLKGGFNVTASTNENCSNSRDCPPRTDSQLCGNITVCFI